jgi:hypothetical protein
MKQSMIDRIGVWFIILLIMFFIFGFPFYVIDFSIDINERKYFIGSTDLISCQINFGLTEILKTID